MSLVLYMRCLLIGAFLTEASSSRRNKFVEARQVEHLSPNPNRPLPTCYLLGGLEVLLKVLRVHNV